MGIRDEPVKNLRRGACGLGRGFGRHRSPSLFFGPLSNLLDATYLKSVKARLQPRRDPHRQFDGLLLTKIPPRTVKPDPSHESVIPDCLHTRSAVLDLVGLTLGLGKSTGQSGTGISNEIVDA